MKKVMIFFISLFFSGVPFSVDAQFFREAFIPEEFLPENTLAVCVFTNLQETVERFQQTLFFEALYSEPHDTPSRSISTTPSAESLMSNVEGLRTGPSKEVFSPLTDFRTGIRPALKKMQQEFSSFAEEFRKSAGFGLSDIWAIFHNSITLALVDISPGEIVGTNRPSLQFAFIADVHDSAGILRNILETNIVPRIQTEDPTVEFLVESFEGMNIYGLANEQFRVYYTFLERAFVVTLDQETIRKIISVSNEGNLFNALHYRSVVGDVHEDRHEARVYVDIQQIWLKVRPYIHQVCTNKPSPEHTFILNVLDGNQLQSLFWTFSYRNRGGYERLFFKMKNQKNQVFDKNLVSSGGNNIFTSDRLVPVNVLYYGTSRVNLLEIWQQFSALINSSPYPQQIEYFNNWVKKVEDTFHVDIEKEFLAAFGQEIAIVCHSGEFRRRVVRETDSLEDFPFLVLFQIKDKTLLERKIQNIFTGLHIEVRKAAYQNAEIQSFALSGKIAPFIVHTAFVKDFLVISLSRTLLQEFITASQHGKSLTTVEDYRQLSSYFPPKGHSKGYLNIAKLSGVIRRFLKHRNGSEPSLWNDTSALIFDLAVLAERLPGMMWVTTVVSDGFLTESFSPIGGAVTGIALTWFGLSFFK